MQKPEYLNNTRKRTDGTLVSELKLLSTDEEFATNWRELMEVKKQIADEKLKALAEIDLKYKEELERVESNYALILLISR